MAKKTADKTTKNSTKQEKKVVGKPFEKGKSGNPNGRPKGKRNFETIFKEAQEEAAKDMYQALCDKADKNGLPRPEPLTIEDIERMIEKRAVKESINGNFQFYKETRDRLYGKAAQPLEHTMDNEIKDALKKLNTIIPD